MSSDPTRIESLVEEAGRVLAICNACRYCEGYCAVFPALERRLAFTEADMHYLGNLCHNCGSCLYACQYAPPHEFQLDFPRTMARLRAQSYRRYAWPQFLAAAFERNGLVTSLAMAACMVLLVLGIALASGPTHLVTAYSDAEGAFYALMPHNVMAGLFGAVFLYALVALGAGFVRFWREGGEPLGALAHPGASAEGTWDALSLRNLDGGGVGCTYPDAKPSFARRRFHHLTFYGFLLCFAATCVGTLYHYGFGWKAPYAWTSLPVVLGTLGGVGLLAGPAGLLWLKAARDPELADPAQDGMDAGFLVLLFLTSLSGLVLLAARQSAAMGFTLAVHLGLVMAFFLTMPYGKFVHGIYRVGALVRFHLERRRPLPDVAAE